MIFEMKKLLLAIISDGFYGAGVQSRLAFFFFFFVFGLFIDVGVPMLVVANEVVGSFRPASIAVDALPIYIKFSDHVVGPLVRLFCHVRLFYEMEGRTVNQIPE